MEIDLASKENHMNIIARFYLKILHEFFTINTGNVGQHERETDSEASQFKVGDTMQHGLQHTVHEKEDKDLKSMFEKIINELRNIEYTLNFFIRISKSNKSKKPTQILSNISKHGALAPINETPNTKTPDKKLKKPSN